MPTARNKKVSGTCCGGHLLPNHSSGAFIVPPSYSTGALVSLRKPSAGAKVITHKYKEGEKADSRYEGRK